MILPVFAATLLAAAVPASAGVPAAVPATSDISSGSAQGAGASTQPVPVAPPAPTPPADPAPAPGNPSDDQNAIVVTALPPSPPGDPLQEVNVESYKVIQSADRALVAPAAQSYKETFPKPVRNGLRNFLNNLHEPIVFVNFLLQLKPGKAAETVGRFLINTTAGGAGLFDVAKKPPFNLPRRPNGMANTLGYYGVKPGPFLFLPLIGATTLRDMIGGGLDGFVLPTAVGPPFNSLYYTLPTAVLRGLDERSRYRPSPSTTADGDTNGYAAVRAAYLQRRQAEIDALHNRRTAVPKPASEIPSLAPPQ